MSDDFDIKILEIKKKKTVIYKATLIYKGGNPDFIDYIKKINTSGNLVGPAICIQELASVIITFYSDTQSEPYEYNYDYDDNPHLVVYYKDGHDAFLNGFYNMLTQYKMDTTKFPFLKQVKGISYGMLLCCICKAIKEGLITLSSTIILEASGEIIDMDSRQNMANLVKYYERIGFKKMFPEYYKIAIESESGFIPMIAQVKDIIRLCNFKNISNELLAILPIDLCKDICTEKEEQHSKDRVTYVCDILTKTYNTNVLDSESTIIKDEFLSASLQNHKGNKGKKVLMNLICNHFSKDPTKQKPMPRFIGGPKNVTVHLSKEYNKTIYIFGEHHSDMIDCDEIFKYESIKEKWDEPNSKKMKVEYFLTEFVRTTDVFLDIFFEFPIIPKVEGKYHDNFNSLQPNTRMDKLLEKFKKCLQRNTRTEECKLARIHYFDIRILDEQGKMKVSNLTTYFYHNSAAQFSNFFRSELPDKLRVFIKDPIIKKILNELSEPNEERYKDIWLKHLSDFSHNMKELDRLDKEMKDKILHFIKKEIIEKIMKYRRSWIANVYIIFNNHEYTDEQFVTAFENTYKPVLRINVLYTDLYTLLRIFKKFKISEMKEKAYKEATDQPEKAHNIIIYAGDFHAQTYRKFLKEVLNFEKIEVAGKEEKYESDFEGEIINCVDMKTITQPLFSIFPYRHEYKTVL